MEHQRFPSGASPHTPTQVFFIPLIVLLRGPRPRPRPPAASDRGEAPGRAPPRAGDTRLLPPNRQPREAPAAWRPGGEDGEASPQRGVTSVSGRLAWAGPPPHPTPPHPTGPRPRLLGVRVPAPASLRARTRLSGPARARARACLCARACASASARVYLCACAPRPLRGGGPSPSPRQYFRPPLPPPIPSPPPLAPQPPLTAPLTLLSAALCSRLPILFLPLPPLSPPHPLRAPRAPGTPRPSLTPLLSRPLSSSAPLYPACSPARSLARSLSTLGSPLFLSLVAVRSPPFLRLLSSLSCSALAFSSRPWPSSPSFSVAVPVPPRPLPLSPPCVSAFLPRLASLLPVRSSAPHPPLLSRTVFCPRPSSPVRSLPLPTVSLRLSPSFSFPRRRSPRHRLPSPPLSQGLPPACLLGLPSSYPSSFRVFPPALSLPFFPPGSPLLLASIPSLPTPSLSLPLSSLSSESAASLSPLPDFSPRTGLLSSEPCLPGGPSTPSPRQGP
ncbi:vegetative cell wall protein gp1-like [Leopardus geoffroyi]|uniref:vegetative cell wall protein gp1-like n=1 Tax=Leopardus geoffroyi TaxID=46844 RepID=UPI001E25FD59|nr:vegetative cell wall protein gp1-like [Leopardus geoffroyi]